MGKVIDHENLKVNTPRHEKFWHHDTFGPLNLDAPPCKVDGCRRQSWLGDYCPDHKIPAQKGLYADRD